MRRFCRRRSGASLVVLCSTATAVVGQASSSQLDVEVARRAHLQDCEALPQRLAHDGPWADLQNDVIELLKSPQVLPLNSRSLVVDENGDPELWTLTRGFFVRRTLSQGLERRHGQLLLSQLGSCRSQGIQRIGGQLRRARVRWCASLV